MTTHRRLLSVLATTTVATTLAAGSLVVPLAGQASGEIPPLRSVTIALTKPATRQLTAGGNKVEARGEATGGRYKGRIFLMLNFRNQGEQGPVEAFAGQIAYTGPGPDVVWRRLQVDFTEDVITGFTGRGKRLRLMRTVTLDTDRYGFDEDTALTLTVAGARSLNLAAKGDPFRAGDLVATADGLA